jgi:hypothetical protein
MSDLFDGIEAITIGNQGGTPLTEGEYLVQLEDVIHLKTQKKGEAFIVEYTVVESSDQEKHPVGSKRSWYQNMGNSPVALSEITKFMYALLGYDSKRDETRIKTEVTPFLKGLTQAACRKPYKDSQTGQDVPGKIFNGKGMRLRVTMFRKAPNAAALLKDPNSKGFVNPRFSPASPNPPPVRAA